MTLLRPVLAGIALASLVQAAPAQPADMLGRVRVHVATADDTLLDLARDNGLGFVEIVAANPGVDPWLPGSGTRIVLPTAHLLPTAPRRGIVINVAEQRLYFFPPGRPARSYPIGVPSAGMDLRTGTTRIVAKREKPVWIPPPSVRAEDPELPPSVPPGPDNPLGQFALDTGWTDIVVHGTNRPYGIGRRVSHGCFRLYPDDIAELYRDVAIGTPVTVVDQEAKLGWVDDELYLEVHPSLAQADELEAHGKFTPLPVVGLDRLVLEASVPLSERIDWRKVDRVALERRGVPERIFRPATAPAPQWR